MSIISIKIFLIFYVGPYVMFEIILDPTYLTKRLFRFIVLWRKIHSCNTKFKKLKNPHAELPLLITSRSFNSIKKNLLSCLVQLQVQMKHLWGCFPHLQQKIEGCPWTKFLILLKFFPITSKYRHILEVLWVQFQPLT